MPTQYQLFHSFRTRDMCVVGGSLPKTLLFLVSHPLPASVVGVKFSTISHNQGFCDCPDLGNWTWFEAAILRRLSAEEKDVSPRVRWAHTNVQEFAEEIQQQGWEFVSIANEETPHLGLSILLHHTELSRQWRQNEVYWRRTDDHLPAEAKQFMDTLREGDRIAVFVKAQFPGWMNFVRSVSIELDVLTELDSSRGVWTPRTCDPNAPTAEDSDIVLGSKGFWAEAGDSKNQDAPARRQGVSLTQKTQKNAKARVAQISYCSDGKCVVSEPNHLRISFLDVELHRNNATAISYTWGEFYREPVYIGHTSEGKALHMELGKEWIRDEVIRCLAELGGERPCWIDQLCIPQTDQEIRNVLAKIPSIYRSFDVTVLMPGSPCSCLERFLELSIEANERLDSVSEEEHLKDFLARMQPRSMCLNGGGGLSSWFFRVWTRQELLYSNRIHVTWVAKTKAKCVMQGHGANVEDLAPFAANMYACLVRQGMRSESAQYKLISFASKVGVRAASDLLLYNSELPWELEDALFFFLSGEVVQRGPPSRRIPLSPELKFSVERDHRIDAGEAFRFYHFLDSLTGLRGNRFRVATRARDYVVSIWVDCPRYALPAHQKEMTAPEYLQDAFEQLHRTFSVTIASYAPRGLFKSGPGSALWDPVTYLANADIRSGAMLYGPIALEGTCVFLASPTKVVPLHRLGQGDRLPISSRAVEYHQAFKETDSGSIINVMRDSFTHWAISADMGFSAVMEDYMEGPDFQDTTEFEATLNTEKSPHDTCNPPLSHHASFGTYLERSPIPMLTRIAAAKSSIRDLIAVFPGCSGPSNPENALKECAIPAQRRDDVIYEVVASALGLDPDVCRIHGLRVMIARGEAELPTRIGLFRGDVDLSAVSESKAEGKVLTVCVAQKDLSRSGPWRLGIMTSAHSVLYEALRVN